MTDPKPAKAAAAKTPASQAPAKAAAKAPAAKAPVTKAPVAKTPVAKTPVAKTSAAKTPAAKVPAAKTAATRTPAAKTSATKAAPATRAKAPAKSTTAATTSVAPPVPVAAPPVPVAAAAPAGWYPVAPGSAQQRYWDGAAWTEHFHPATAPAPVTPVVPVAAHHGHPAAPEGTSGNTVWIWLAIASLLIGIAASVFQLPAITGNYGSVNAAVNSSIPFLVSALLSLVELVAYVVFAVLDWRALGKQGVPKPFHWAWSLTALILSSPIVYVIGRTVVVKRRTGKGLAPLWVFIGLQIVAWIFGLVVLVVVLTQLANQFSNLLSDAGNVL